MIMRNTLAPEVPEYRYLYKKQSNHYYKEANIANPDIDSAQVSSSKFNIARYHYYLATA